MRLQLSDQTPPEGTLSVYAYKHGGGVALRAKDSNGTSWWIFNINEEGVGHLWKGIQSSSGIRPSKSTQIKLTRELP